MKLQSHDDAVPAPDLVKAAVKAVAATSNEGDSKTVIDGEKIKDNFSAMAATFPKVTPLVKAGSLCSELAAFMTEHLDGLGWFVVFNKPELESALANGIEPARLALLAGFKPAAAIKLGLKSGIKTYGCGSVSEMSKIAKAKKQVGTSAGMESLDICIVLDPVELLPLDQLLQMLDMAGCQGDRVVGISLQSTEDVGDDAYAKAVALSRLAFEAFEWGQQQQVVFDLGEMKDEKKGEERAAKVAAQLKQLPTAMRVKLAAQMGQVIMKDSVGLAVKVIAVSKENEAAVVNESIYGAFSGLLAGQFELEPPLIVAGEHSPARNAATYDIFGSSGENSDVILAGTPIVGLNGRLRAGDWVIFPNLTWPESSVHLSVASSSPPSPWMTLKEDYSDISELEALFTLPDLTEEALENMFNI